MLVHRQTQDPLQIEFDDLQNMKSEDLPSETGRIDSPIESLKESEYDEPEVE